MGEMTPTMGAMARLNPWFVLLIVCTGGPAMEASMGDSTSSETTGRIIAKRGQPCILSAKLCEGSCTSTCR